MESEAGPKEEKYLAEMSLRRGGKHPVYTKVRLFPTPNEDDPRPFIAKDSSGKEMELDLREQAMAEIIVLGKPTADTMDMLRLQNSRSSPKPPHK